MSSTQRNRQVAEFGNKILENKILEEDIINFLRYLLNLDGIWDRTHQTVLHTLRHQYL